MSAYYGPAMEDKDAFPLLDRAIELGCTFWDTRFIRSSEDKSAHAKIVCQQRVRRK